VPGAAALLEEIRTLYADRLNEGFQAFRLRFRRLTDEESAVERARKQAKKAVAAARSSAPPPRGDAAD
jgi:hypothetical protein